MSMEALLPYYERELGFLRRYSREFSEQYPKIAGQLLMSGEVCEDPHIERLIQSFALMNARVAKRLDDDYPQFTEALLEVMYPHYLRPFPSCSVASFDASTAVNQLNSDTLIPRGTVLRTRAVRGVNCMFTTAYDVRLQPLLLTDVVFKPIPDLPEQLVPPTGASSRISLSFALANPQTSLKQVSLDKIRLFLDAEPSLVAALRDSLLMSECQAYVELDGRGVWHRLEGWPVNEVGYADEDALIPMDARAHPAYRLLTEYFAFPEKFNFVDVCLSGAKPWVGETHRRITLHLVLAGIRPDSSKSRMLQTLSSRHLVQHCTPVVNLFSKAGEPIRMTHTTPSYSVVADARRASAYEVYAIDRLTMVRQTPGGEALTEFSPFYALHHGAKQDGAFYWVLRRDGLLMDKSPGYEAQLSLVDAAFHPANLEQQTLSLSLSCTNRDLPSQLTYGAAGGDLFMEGGSLVKSVRFLRKPTPSVRFANDQGMHWRLISHLSLNQLSLTEGGLSALQALLQLYDLPGSASNQLQIQGLVAMTTRAAQTWMQGNPFACMVRGTKVELTVDEQAFVGGGLQVFARLLDHFFALYAYANSFTQLSLYSQHSGELLLEFSPRCGDLKLL